jgi:hypothetical protein
VCDRSLLAKKIIMKSTTARVLSLAIFLLAQQKSVLSQEFEIKVPTLSVAGPGDSQASEKEAAPVASRDTPFVETPGKKRTLLGFDQ